MPTFACMGEQWRSTTPGKLHPKVDHEIVSIRRHKVRVKAPDIRLAAIEFEKLTGVELLEVNGIPVVGRCECCTAPVLDDMVIHGDAGILFCADELACYKTAKWSLGKVKGPVLADL